MKLGTHVAAGLMIAGGIAALAAGGVLLLGAAAATAIKIGMTVFLAGSLYVGEQALSDIRSGRVSDLDQAGGIAALAAGGVLLLGAAAATAIKIGMTVFLAGSLYVGEQALSDIRSGRVSDLDQYTRKAVAGSVVGFLTGASGLLMAEASLWGVLALGFGEGLVGSIVTQKLLNEDGEDRCKRSFDGGGKSLGSTGAWLWGRIGWKYCDAEASQ